MNNQEMIKLLKAKLKEYNVPFDHWYRANAEIFIIKETTIIIYEDDTFEITTNSVKTNKILTRDVEHIFFSSGDSFEFFYFTFFSHNIIITVQYENDWN